MGVLREGNAPFTCPLMHAQCLLGSAPWYQPSRNDFLEPRNPRVTVHTLANHQVPAAIQCGNMSLASLRALLEWSQRHLSALQPAPVRLLPLLLEGVVPRQS